jgi:alpha-D-ribose 1-methylphosphonate 5-triphosphate diphosphatase
MDFLDGAARWFRNARIVTPDRVLIGCLKVEDSRIEEIGEDGSRGAGIDFEGDYLLPGLIELHTDHLESHYFPRPAVTWHAGSSVLAYDAQIAAPGITTVFDSFRVGVDEYEAGAGAGLVTMSPSSPRQRAGRRKQVRCQKVGHARALENRPRIVEIAKARGIALASHDDTTTEEVALARRDGVTIAELPTTLEAALASRAAGMATVMGAPNVVRGGSHSGNASARELAEAGHLDILSSDYLPAALLMAAFRLADAPAVGGLAGTIRLVSKAPTRLGSRLNQVHRMMMAASMIAAAKVAASLS